MISRRDMQRQTVQAIAEDQSCAARAALRCGSSGLSVSECDSERYKCPGSATRHRWPAATLQMVVAAGVAHRMAHRESIPFPAQWISAAIDTRPSWSTAVRDFELPPAFATPNENELLRQAARLLEGTPFEYALGTARPSDGAVEFSRSGLSLGRKVDHGLVDARGAASDVGAMADSDDDCPEGICVLSAPLPTMAKSWWEAGGLSKEIVELLYIVAAEAFCNSSDCIKASNGKYEDCEYSKSQIYKATYEKFTDRGIEWVYDWIYRWTCCCSFVSDPKGPGVPRLGPGNFSPNM